ncbi:MAG: DUF1351 domain-containing protein [Oscillospiraceae bacterium]|nr:DUF1351 domain-containing protein [Oscillospiraceae bacterium]
MMEFKMTTDLNTALPAEITFNFDELKTELEERLDYYNHLVVTEDTIKESKADRAKLNKLRDAIDTRRKEIKKACMAPYTAFETKVKELTALIDAPVAAIDNQLKVFEDQRKEEKMQLIVDCYDTLVSNTIKDIIPLERIFSEKWLNATMSMTKIEDEFIMWGKRVSADLIALDTVEPEYKAAVRAKYIETLDVTAALDHKKALQEAAEAFRAREEAKATQEATKAAAPEMAPRIEPQAAPEHGRTEKRYALRLEFHLTMAQANNLKKFLAEAGIEYTKI